jgi:hypothetical protein
VTPYGFVNRYKKVSEECDKFILREDYSSTLNMEASDASEMRYLSNQTTRHHIPENTYLNSCRQNTDLKVDAYASVREAARLLLYVRKKIKIGKK